MDKVLSSRNAAQQAIDVFPSKFDSYNNTTSSKEAWDSPEDRFSDSVYKDGCRREGNRDPEVPRRRYRQTTIQEQKDIVPQPTAMTSSKPKHKRGQRGGNQYSKGAYVVTDVGPASEPKEPPIAHAKFQNSFGALITMTLKASEFSSNRQMDKLTGGLGNKEHTSHLRGISSKLGLKHGFQEAHSSKKHDLDKEEIKEHVAAALKKVCATVFPLQHQPLASLMPQPSVFPRRSSSSIDSMAVQRLPVDDIVAPTACSLHIPVGRAGKRKIEVAKGFAYPGRDFHYQPIPKWYSKVQVVTVQPEYIDFVIDIPTSEGVRCLGEAVNQFILWHRQDIILTSAPQPLLPSPSLP